MTTTATTMDNTPPTIPPTSSAFTDPLDTGGDSKILIFLTPQVMNLELNFCKVLKFPTSLNLSL